MFISRGTYDGLLTKYSIMCLRYSNLKVEWNDLVERINAKGGEGFLKGSKEQQFSKSEIKQLLFLCHPDKHDNSSKATEITVKLLELRQEL